MVVGASVLCELPFGDVEAEEMRGNSSGSESSKRRSRRRRRGRGRRRRKTEVIRVGVALPRGIRYTLSKVI